jgi:uncharacterized membrane protein
MKQPERPTTFVKVCRRLLLLVVFLLLAVQAIPVKRENPAVDQTKKLEATAIVPPEIHGILRRSCNDCHSNETVWPWYSHVAPVSWVVVYDVREGRADLNFSDWGSYSIKERSDKLEDICGRVRRDEMPDGKYTLIHRNARLTTDERNAVCAWSEQVRKGLDSSGPASSSPQASMLQP